MNEPTIRLVRPTDINALTMMDLKCYHYPMTLQEWQTKVNDKETNTQIVVAEYHRTPVGFAMWGINLDDVGEIHRLGVLPQHRRKHLGKLLMSSVFAAMRTKYCLKVRCVIPALHCFPGDPDDVSEFLTKCGFKTTGEVIPDFKWMYGDAIDGYVFERNTDAFTK